MEAIVDRSAFVHLARSLWPEDSLSLHDSPLASRTCFCLLIPDSSMCPALFLFTNIHSSTLTLSPMQAREALPLHPSFSWLPPSISCFCAISTCQLKLFTSSIFQSSLPLLMPKGWCWRPEITLCFSYPPPKGLQNTRRSGCSESSQEFCSCCPCSVQGNWWELSCQHVWGFRRSQFVCIWMEFYRNSKVIDSCISMNLMTVLSN